MKLVILCGSLESGKDGVGDYSRQLANYCRAQGHNVYLCSINDSWIANNIDEPIQQEMRIARSQLWEQRAKVFKNLLASFQPDFVSLQFVPYAYHHRGFCYDLVRTLTPLASKYRWQIMFHELWLGLNPTDSIKYKVLGYLQRHYAFKLIEQLSPKVIHTQATAYHQILKEAHVNSIRLPLFSNINLEIKVGFTEVYDLLAQHGSDLNPINRPNTFVVLFFGSLHPEWNPNLFMEKLGGKELLFLSLGRLGMTGIKIWRKFAEKYNHIAKFIELGELSPEKISTILQFGDAGVAASPWNLIEKSGSVAAMIEHGLPVIVTRNDFLPSKKYDFDLTWSQHLHPVWLETFDIDRLIKKEPTIRLPQIGDQFLTDLQTALEKR